MRHLVITAPDQLRARLKGLSVIALVNEAARLRPSRSGDAVMAAHKAALCSLARRIQGLDDELAELDRQHRGAHRICRPRTPGSLWGWS